MPPLAPPHRPLMMRGINGIGGMLDRVGVELASLDEENLIRSAMQHTGLDDFGDDAFRLPLRILLEAIANEADLHSLGKIIGRRTILGYLENRLKLAAYRKAHPELDDERVEKPIFIVGLPRTGTTILFNLLAQDPANRVPLTWEVEQPCPPPEVATLHTDPRIRDAKKIFKNLDKMLPPLRAMHEFGAELPQECVVMKSHAFMSVGFHSQFNVASYQAWLDVADHAPAYRYHRRFLQHLQSKAPRDRWVLKTPGHLAHMESLVAEYPNAHIVHTHRDPTQVMASLSSLIYVLRTLASDSVSPRVCGEQTVDMWGHALDRAVQARERLRTRSAQFFDVQFGEVLNDPVDVVRRAYEYFELPWTPGVERRMQAFLANNPRGKYGKHTYDLGDFGLRAEPIRRRFADYCETFGVETRAN